jgi:hypothetical protein
MQPHLSIFPTRRLRAAALCAFSLTLLPGQTGKSADEYHIYTGSTHAHTASTWSHGDQWAKNGCAGILVYSRGPGAAVHTWSSGYVKSQNGCSGIFVIDGSQYPSPDVKLKPDWREGQGPPSEHYSLAKAKGYDFYVTSDLRRKPRSSLRANRTPSSRPPSSRPRRPPAPNSRRSRALSSPKMTDQAGWAIST